MNIIAQKWSEKPQWLVRYRILATSENPAPGVQKGQFLTSPFANFEYAGRKHWVLGL